MQPKRWIALGFAALIFIASLLTNFLGQQETESSTDRLLSSFSEGLNEKTLVEGSVTKRIAVLSVNGTIQSGTGGLLEKSSYDHARFLQELAQVENDPSVRGLIVRVNSPGGGVVESAEVHKKLLDYKKKTKNPVYVSIGSMAASGGYYIATAADKVFAPKEALTGSLGVILQSVNYGELAKKYGVEFVTIKSGPYKDIMSPNRPMTAGEKSILQTMIQSSYDEFVRVIAEGRGMSEAQVRKIADGRIYDGRQAKALNLIDEFGYFEEAVAALEKDEKVKGAQVFEYEVENDWQALLKSATNYYVAPSAEIATLTKLFGRSNAPRLMYLYAE